MIEALPRLQHPPSFSGTIEPVGRHETERADDYIDDISLFRIFGSGQR
jgi:hypothetical protein